MVKAVRELLAYSKVMLIYTAGTLFTEHACKVHEASKGRLNDRCYSVYIESINQHV